MKGLIMLLKLSKNTDIKLFGFDIGRRSTVTCASDFWDAEDLDILGWVMAGPADVEFFSRVR